MAVCIACCRLPSTRWAVGAARWGRHWALEFARDRSKSRSQKGVSWASRSAPRARGASTTGLRGHKGGRPVEDRNYRRVSPTIIEQRSSCPGGHQPYSMAPSTHGAPSHGAVGEAIVKIHSSINLGCVRNPPSREQDSAEGQPVHDPLGLSPDSSLLGGRQVLCADTYMLVYRLELQDDQRQVRIRGPDRGPLDV